MKEKRIEQGQDRKVSNLENQKIVKIDQRLMTNNEKDQRKTTLQGEMQLHQQKVLANQKEKDQDPRMKKLKEIIPKVRK